MALKGLIKSTMAGAMYYSGILRRMERPPLTVLGYHRVLDIPLAQVDDTPVGMIVTRTMFEKQLAFTAKHYRMVSLEQIVESAEGRKPLPERAAFVCFDDGCLDNYTIAWPILKRMGIPAAVFVTTDYVGSDDVFWYTPLMRFLLGSNGRRPRAGDAAAAGWPEDVGGELDRLVSQDRDLRPGELTPLIQMLKRYSEAEIEELVARLGRHLGANGDRAKERYFLDWEQIREMDAEGTVRFGSHTRSHKILTQIDDAAARQELQGSKERLEQELDHTCESIAFPNGDYTPQHIKDAWDVGYRAFFISTRVHAGGPEGRVFPRPCVWDNVGRSASGGFSPSLMEMHLAGALDRLKLGSGRN